MKTGNSPICSLSNMYGKFVKCPNNFEMYHMVATSESFFLLTVCFPSRRSLFTTNSKKYVGRKGGGGGRG